MKQLNFITWRFYLVLLLIVLVVAILLSRIVYLSIFNQPALQTAGDKRVLRLVSRPAFRGMIIDRNSHPLAVSTTVYSLSVNPLVFTANPESLERLAALSQMRREVLESKLRKALKKRQQFLYLARQVSPEVAEAVKALNLQHVHLTPKYHRYYPEGEVTAHLIGMTNVDDRGQEGLELAYDEWLAGLPEKKWVIQDRMGRAIRDVRLLQEQASGQSLQLSIDRRIQYIAYRALMQSVIDNQADSGSVIVLDVTTGEILAMVNYPSFNPNRRDGNEKAYYRNRAVTDIFEPGSTIKAFSVASALESGQFTRETVIDTTPIRVGKKLLKDEHAHGPSLTVTQVLEQSSNVGVTRMMLNLEDEALFSLLRRVGFGEATNVGFPGEQNGVLVQPKQWGELGLATLAFGYGLSVTALQLARAYLVIANYGEKIPITLFKQTARPKSERVMDEKLAKEMLVLLESVVQHGTGEQAKVPGYRVAGKTGTARIAGAHGYERKYTSSFVGIAPASRPRLVVAAVVHNPKGGKYYGASVSGPIFEETMESALRLLAIAPDAQHEVTAA